MTEAISWLGKKFHCLEIGMASLLCSLISYLKSVSNTGFLIEAHFFENIFSNVIEMENTLNVWFFYSDVTLTPHDGRWH